MIWIIWCLERFRFVVSAASLLCCLHSCRSANIFKRVQLRLSVVWFVDPGGVLSAHRGSVHWLLFKCDSSFNVTDVRDIYRQSGTSEVLNDKSH